MKLTQINNIYQLAFLPNLFPVNCYLVEESDGLTLIDAALPYCAKGILQAAERIGKPITNIVLTHAHDDHVGALDALKRVLTDVPVFISKRDARLMAGDMTLEQEEPNTPIKGSVSTKIKTRADILLEDGQQIGSLQTIETPGHTPGSMSFLDTRNDALIAGDAFQTRGGVAVAGQLKWLFPFPAFGTWHAETALKSAQKLLQYNPSVLAAGHGKMIENPISHIQQAIEQANYHLTRKGG
ncbi:MULTISPECIES: MBL fold metallo-hydrolase [unclassified Bacillus cereus group]|uniref:MBL fold metallo-hydrolase n=1 Tax=unclassified Bacillus cereus group TaxID=2750818 RepID=UPI001F564636|nr:MULTISPECIES: MBL fold metallo-hydrolase [unclassified Bacillus cereus group]